jgi:serine/threonine protein kinase
LSEQVASGGSARVYKAIDAEPPNTVVAIKVLDRSAERDDALLNLMFDRETRAYRRLRHPNIVELIGGGRDPESGEPYFILEWIDQDLAKYLKGRKLEGWDSFAEMFGMPILEALAYAHGEGVAHRDVKPSNVLVTAANVPKLTDFGVAKLKTDFQPGLTLAELQTRPYSPKEFDDGDYTFTRDVHGFGVLVLMSLTGINPFADEYRDDPYKAVSDALRAVDLPPAVHEFLARCVSDDPRERPLNAVLARTELAQIQEKRTGAWIKPVRFHFVFAANVEKLIRETLNVPDSTNVSRLLEDELSGDIAVVSWPDKDQKARTDAFQLFGDTLRVLVRIRQGVQDALVVFGAFDLPHSLLLKRRDHAYRIRMEARQAEPSSRAEAKQALTDLQIAVVAHEREEEARQRLEERQRIFWTWRHTLDAKVDLEREREDPLNYDHYEVAGRDVFFHLRDAAAKGVLGQSRRVQLIGGDYVVGLVTDLRGDSLVLSVVTGDTSRIPRSGVLRIDNRAARVAVRRQHAAVEAVQYKQALRPDLDELLIEPERARPPTTVPAVVFLQAGLDQPKQEAVTAALGTQDFLVVHGPPGTGKTKFITELVLQTARDKGARILVTSQTHAALDNALENLKAADPSLKMVRIARPEDPRVSPDVADFLLGAQIERWRDQAVRQGRDYLRAWAESNGLSDRAVEIAGIFEDLAVLTTTAVRQAEAIQAAEAELVKLKAEDPSVTAEEGITLQVEIESLKSRQEDVDKRRRDSIARLRQIGAIASLNELDGLSAEELAGRATQHVSPQHPAYRQCLELLKLRADWQARFGLGDEFQAAVLLRSQVVAATCLGVQSFRGADAIEFDLCIVDEASRATATELLVPLIQARRWILVGDPKQLPAFVESALTRREILTEHDLTEADVKTTLFDRLIERLPIACQRTLSVQHRMVPAIGDLVSQVFYEGKLVTGDVNGPAWLWAFAPKPVVWLTTSSKGDRRREQQVAYGTSRQNQLEAEVVRAALDRLQFCANSQKATLTVALLSGYVGQRDVIRRVIAERVGTWSALQIDCSTVDAFQGRQADICVYSVTRSNSAGDLGFLREEPRLNVALSRGRYGLVIVGDHLFVREARDDPNPLAAVVEYIERHQDSCSLSEATT